MTPDAPVYLVTGAGGNLGRAVVEALARGGARIAAADRSGAPAGDGDRLILGGADFFDAAACEAIVAAVVERYGRIDGVAHTVGGFATAKAAEAVPELWTDMFRLNVLTTLNVFRAALPPMRAAGGGALVAVAAGAGLQATSGLGAYAASKAGVLRLVEAFAAELKAEGVRVNAVLPGAMDTPQNRAAMPKVDPRRWARTGEVAEAIAFLLGPGASGITGVGLPVPGRM